MSNNIKKALNQIFINIFWKNKQKNGENEKKIEIKRYKNKKHLQIVYWHNIITFVSGFHKRYFRIVVNVIFF